MKAIAWSPHQQGLLASGGGTADRYIRFWNTLTAQSLQCIDTGSQVKIIRNQTFLLIVKHDLKGVLKYKGQNFHPPPDITMETAQTVSRDRRVGPGSGF